VSSPTCSFVMSYERNLMPAPEYDETQICDQHQVLTANYATYV